MGRGQHSLLWGSGSWSTGGMSGWRTSRGMKRVCDAVIGEMGDGSTVGAGPPVLRAQLGGSGAGGGCH